MHRHGGGAAVKDIGTQTQGAGSAGPGHTDTGGCSEQVLGSISLGLLLRNHNILFILGNLEPCGTSLRLQDGDNGHGEELTATGNSREQGGWGARWHAQH